MPRRSAVAAFGTALALGKARALAIALVLGASLTAAAGCGYQLAARPPLPGGVERVAVPLVRNDTAEPEAGRVMSDALGLRAQLDDRLGGDAAEARLEGRVVSVEAAGAAFPVGVRGPGAWEVALRVELRLVPRGGGAPLDEVTVAGTEPYFAGAGPEETDANRRRALQRLAERLADEAWARLTGR